MADLKAKNRIFSADDFGLSQSANDNILELVSSGKVRRVSIILEKEGDLRTDEIERLKSSGVALDLHLHFSELTKKGSPARKMRQSGILTSLEILGFYLRNIFRSGAIRKEWSRQIELFRTVFGCLPDGLSSHQYLHFFPAYLEMVLELGRSFGIGYLRFGSQGIFSSGNTTAFILGILNRLGRKKVAESGIGTSRYLSSYDWLDRTEDAPENTEIVCHPERPEEFASLKSLS